MADNCVLFTIYVYFFALSEIVVFSVFFSQIRECLYALPFVKKDCYHMHLKQNYNNVLYIKITI